MRKSEKPYIQWNIFARELQTILAKHGYRLGQLDDRAGIHPQKVSRLQHSLIEPRFNVLTPDEVDSVSAAFDLSEAETLQLRAAILATAIEEMLMDRITNVDALHAADEILPIIYRMLHINSGKSTPLGMVKGGPIIDLEDPLIEEALKMIDHAMLLLHLSLDTTSSDKRSILAKRACDAFTNACVQLETLPLTMQECENWQVWHGEAQHGLVMAKAMVTD